MKSPPTNSAIPRRRSMQHLFLVFISAACLLVLGLTTHAQTAATSTMPDVVYVLGDDQGWGDYGFMGHPHIQTPNLDQMARNSLLFTRGYVPDSLCRPSLATMISGLYPHQHGIVGNDPPPRQPKPNRGGLYSNKDYQQVIETYLQLHVDKLDTLPDRLKPLGYRSFQSGKWWEGNFARGGFDEGMTHGDHSRGARHGDVGLEIGRNTMKPIEDFIGRARKSDKPYFLWYAPMLPHTPHDPSKELLEKYKALAPTESVAKYWAMCERFDQSIGELLKIIEAKGRPDNTLIVFSCDNGWINLPDKSAYAPKSKRSQYDGGVRTPIMFYWPGRIEPRRDETHLACTIDLVPTVLDLVGLPADARLPGISLMDRDAVDSRKILFGEIFEHDIQSMDDPKPSLMYRWAIEGQMKLIVPNPGVIVAGDVELFDLSKDPTEETNLARSRPELVKSLQTKLDAWWK
jgi:arylsulfatase A-like enzyme